MPLPRRAFLAAIAAGAAMAALPVRARAANAPGLLFRDVRLVDGTGAPARTADLLVRGERIERIGRIGARALRGVRIVEGGGRVLAPGFIDLHAHGDPREQSYASHLAMGATTVVLGQDGSSPGDDSLSAWFEAMARATPDINVATAAGHGSLRRLAGIDDGTRMPSAAQIARLAALLDADLAAGAFGLSTGLEYVPGRYAAADELAALGPVVARHGGVAASHLRSEDDDRVEAAIAEHVDASRPARTHVSHLKVVYGQGEARADALLAALRRYRDAGVPLTADAYPYTASYTGIAILFPEWALPPNDYAQVLATRRDELRAALEQRMVRRNGPGALLLGSGEHAGRTLAQVAEAAGRAYPDVLLDLGPGGARAAHFVMDEALQARLLQDPFVAIASDGSPVGRHPRGHGTFARWIEEFVVRDPRVPLEEAVRKASGLPASILGLHDRGVLREGAMADLVLFDPTRVRARADYTDPFAPAEGFDLVVVNGVTAFEAGERTGIAGRLLRRRAAVAGPGG
ncbi:N-acyl-D-amino-acid deacylase family protein [Luteimonas viscosa]|nr:amidohydrolase family protein [Luteimonas viscosa]